MSSAESLHQRGIDALTAKNFAQAIDLFNQAIERDSLVAKYFVNRGLAQRALRQSDRAIDDFRLAIKLQPTNAIAHFNLGVALRDLNQIDAAIASYREAIRIKLDYAKAHYNLANALRATGNLGEAESAYRAAISIDPNYAQAWNNLGELLEELRKVDESMAAFSRSIELRPHHAGAHFNRGFLRLLAGDYERGWKEYEARFAAMNIAPYSTSIPRWTGEDLKGKTILLIGEQGAGDTIQFVRFAKTLAELGAKVIVRASQSVEKLVRSVPGVADVFTDNDVIPSADFHIPMLSVPAILNTTLATIPSQIPYISPDENDVERWRAKLAPQKRSLNIGLSWAGNPQQANDRNRSALLSALKSLAEIKNAAIFSLQKGPASSQIAQCGFEVMDPSNEIENFSDTAAIIANLDVVISVCTSVAHVAGAMGKKTFVMLCFNSDWRWLLDREDSPWYPTMKLFRQKSAGDWEDVARRVRNELSGMA